MTQRQKSVKLIKQQRQQSKFPQKLEQKQQIINVHQILQSIQRQQDISMDQLKNEMRQFKMRYNQTVKQVNRLRKQIQLRPTSHILTQNTILITSSVNSDPNILKLLHSKQTQNNSIKQNNQFIKQKQKESTQQQQLKYASVKLGHKLSQINDGLPILLQMIKSLQKKSLFELGQLKHLFEQKTQSLQQQLNQLKMQQITQHINLRQRNDTQYQNIQQKLRQLQTKQVWDIKDVRSKLTQKIQKQQFDISLNKIVKQNKQIIKKFQQQSTSLVNPQKIKQLQQTIKTNRQVLSKQLVDCELKIQSMKQKISKQIVSIQYYKKQRTSIQKRISTININFNQLHQKVIHLSNNSNDFSNRIIHLQTQNHQKTYTIKQMKTILINLSITEQFQKMLSQIDPQKIIALQHKIQNIQLSNKQFQLLFNKIHQSIDSIYSKFEISGVLIPNKSRDKQYHLNDLTQIIDQYFIQNRYANKISKIQSQLNQGKSNIQTIKLLDKKISKLQKQSNHNHIIQQFNLLQENIQNHIKVLQQKLQLNLSENLYNKHYIQGLINNLNQTKLFKNTQNQQLRKKSLVSSVGNKFKQTHIQRVMSQRTNSLRKIVPWQTSPKQKQILNTSFYKNTISSSRKNLLKSSQLLLGK